MKKLLLLFSFFVLFSCSKSDDIELFESEESGQRYFATDASGLQHPSLDPFKIYCGPGWGRKFCRFLRKYDGTIWTDTENYYSDFSGISFSNFNGGSIFIAFCNNDSIPLYCEEWKFGENTDDGIKWNIKIKKDQVDVLWFDYEYYGSSDEIEYTITYKYEIIDGLLNFTSPEGQTFIFNPYERND